MPDTAAPEPTTATATAAVIDAQALIGRSDTKAGVLLAACVAGVSLAAGTVANLPAPARIPATLTAAALAVAAVLLLLVVLPGGGAITPATLTAQPADRLTLLCALATAKMRRIRLSVFVLLVAVLLAAITAAVALATA